MISNHLVNACISKGIIKREDSEIYEYSFNTLIEFVVIIIFTILIGCVLNRIKLTIVFLIVMIPFRCFMGGWHARTFLGCFLMSNTFYLASIMLPEHMRYDNRFLVAFLVVMWRMFMIVPVQNRNNPLEDYQIAENRFVGRLVVIGTMITTVMLCVANKNEFVIEIIVICTFTYIFMCVEKYSNGSAVV